MTEFGQPQRTATSDANEGIVNPPSVKAEGRDTVSRSVSSRSVQSANLDVGTAAISDTLGTALTNALSGRAQNINEQRALEAATRQGKEQGVTIDDLNQKRTGWKEAIFGQNVEYRAAQQQAIINTVDNLYINQMSTIDDHAGELPEEYSKRLQSGLDTALEKHVGDPETRALITAKYAENARELSSKQLLAHRAFTQTEARRTYEIGLQTQFDKINVDSAQIASAEDAQALYARGIAIFDEANKPESMDYVAWRSTMNDSVNLQLRQGNFGAHNIRSRIDWPLTPAEKLDNDQAIDVYDGHFARKVQIGQRQANLNASKATTVDEAVAAVESGMAVIDQLQELSSGTPKATLAMLNGSDSLQDYINSLKKEGLTALTKAQEAEEEAANIRTAIVSDINGKTNTLHQATKSDKEAGLDAYMSDVVISELGLPEGSPTTVVMDTILNNPEVAANVYDLYTKSSVKSPMVASMVNIAMNGVLTDVDEKGRPSENAVRRFTAATQFMQSTKIENDIGNQAWTRLITMQEGLEAGLTSDMIQSNITAYETYEGKWDSFGIKIPKNADNFAQNRREYVTTLVQKIGGFKPTPAEAAKWTEQWTKGVVISGGNFDGGAKYINRMIHGLGVKYNGTTIPNAAHLKEITARDRSYGFQEVIEGMQRRDINLMGGVISNMFGGTMGGTSTNSLEGIQFKFHTKAGYSGVFISSPEAQNTVRISQEELEYAARALEREQKKDNKMKAARRKANEKALEERVQRLQNSPL